MASGQGCPDLQVIQSISWSKTVLNMNQASLCITHQISPRDDNCRFKNPLDIGISVRVHSLSLSEGAPLPQSSIAPATPFFRSVPGTHDHEETTGQEHQSRNPSDP